MKRKAPFFQFSALILLMLTVVPVHADVRITNVDVLFKENVIQVPYTIANAGLNDFFSVRVEFFDETYRPMNALSLEGDIDIVRGAGDKLITWDVRNDGLIVNQKIHARVYARHVPNPSTLHSFAYSAALPGLGRYQYHPERRHLLRGVLAYGLMGGAVGSLSLSVSAYNKYLASDLPSAHDPNYADARQFRRASRIMGGLGLGIWLMEYAGLYSTYRQHNRLTPQRIADNPSYRELISASPVKHINTRGLPPILFADLEFFDDNGNGILEAQENAEIIVTLHNRGGGDAMFLELDISSDTSDPSLQLKNANQVINRLGPGESKELTVDITTDLDLRTATHRFTINVREQLGYDMEPAYLVLNTYAYQIPEFTISGYEIIDSGPGTQAIIADGKLQAGEIVRARLTVQNIGQGRASDARYSIYTTDDNIYLENTTGSLGDMWPGQVNDIYFTLSPNRRVTTKDQLPIFINITEDIGRGGLRDRRLPIMLDQDPPETHIVEIQPDLDALRTEAWRVEATSDRFRVIVPTVRNIRAVAPSATRRPNSIGVVLGIADYRELPPAPYADNDARVMKDYFERVLGVEQVLMFTNEQISGFKFDDLFNANIGELRRAVVRGETEIFVFYAGHGVPDNEGRNVFLFPHDGRISRLESQGYNVETLYENLSQLGAKHVTVILDACFSGAARSTAKLQTETLTGQRGVRVRPRNSWYGDPNFTVITSSTAEEISLGFDDSETGLFTYYLAAGLQGAADLNNDGKITLGELREYVISNVTETSGRIYGRQTPVFYGNDDRVLVEF
ncbi:MAG: caspase family protein [Bacteroidales bacterium]|nr:caspase family protein [Bacteroidales bacterium]